MTGQAFNARKAKPAASGIGNSDYAGQLRRLPRRRPPDKPWAFWYGAIEPHRGYEFGSGVKPKAASHSPTSTACPPSGPTTRPSARPARLRLRGGALRHPPRPHARRAGARGLLANTLVIVTSDHGMPFPRGKGSAYQYSNHVPFAAMWPAGIAGRSRVVDDYISFVDLAPTFLEVAGLPWAKTGMAASARPQPDRYFPRRPLRPGHPRARPRPHRHGTPRHRPPRRRRLPHPRASSKPGRSTWKTSSPTAGPPATPRPATSTSTPAPPRPSSSTPAANPADPHWALCFGRRPAVGILRPQDADPDCVKNLATSRPPPPSAAALKTEMYCRAQGGGRPAHVSGRAKSSTATCRQPPARSRTSYRPRRLLRTLHEGREAQAGWVNPTDFEQNSATRPSRSAR
jgi:N-sulfoglucosamine sulfohydrolase